MRTPSGSVTTAAEAPMIHPDSITTDTPPPFPPASAPYRIPVTGQPYIMGRFCVSSCTSRPLPPAEDRECRTRACVCVCRTIR